MIPSPAAAAAIAAAWLVYVAIWASDARPSRSRNWAMVVVGSRSGGPTSHCSPPSSDGAIERLPASGCDGAAATMIRQRRNGTDAIVAERSGPGCGPRAMSARRCVEHVGERIPGDRLDRDLDAVVAGAEGVDQRADVLGDQTGCDDLHPARLAGRVLYRAPGLLGEAEDLRGERRQPPSARGQRDPAAVADEQLVARAPCAVRRRRPTPQAR